MQVHRRNSTGLDLSFLEKLRLTIRNNPVSSPSSQAGITLARRPGIVIRGFERGIGDHDGNAKDSSEGKSCKDGCLKHATF